MLPSLPAGAYYLSSALKKKLLLELLKFYSAWDARHSLDRSGGLRVNGDDVEVMIGNPRDTPFMRRKALESVQKQKIHQQRRRQLLATGGEAIIQFSLSSSSNASSAVEMMAAWPSPRPF